MRAIVAGRDRLPRDTRTAAPAQAPGTPSRHARHVPSRALALQRLAGNRAASRLLARWAKHPDEDQKGVMVPDSAAAEFLRLNPPQNK